MSEVNVGALIRLRNAKHLLEHNQYYTLRGQVLAGDAAGAMKGLQRIIQRNRPASAKNNVSRATVKNAEINPKERKQ